VEVEELAGTDRTETFATNPLDAMVAMAASFKHSQALAERDEDYKAIARINRVATDYLDRLEAVVN
jgi:hypothetical protein